MSGCYRKVIGPAKARLDGYLKETLTRRADKSYTTVEECQIAIDRIERVSKLIQNYNDKWISFMGSITDADKSQTEEDHFNDFAEGTTGYVALIEQGEQAIDFLQATKNDIINSSSKSKASTPPSTPPPQGPPPTIFPTSFVLAERELHTFDGNIYKYNEFIQIFKAEVDDQNIPDITKFTQLKKRLTGDAAAVISGLPVVAEHYKEALNLLEKRFGKPTSVKSALFTKLKDLNAAHDDIKSLRQKYEDIVFICRQLSVLGEDLDHQLIIQLIFGKFPQSTMLTLTNVKPLADWKYEDLRDKIDEIISSKEDVNRLYHANRSQHSSTNVDEAAVFSVKTQHKFQKQNFQNRRPTHQHSSSNDTNIKCYLCSKNHLNQDCTTYPTGEQRTNRIKELGRCLICLRNQHTTFECPFKQNAKCNHCGNKFHHSVLCWSKFPKNSNSSSSNINPRNGPKQQFQQKPQTKQFQSQQPRQQQHHQQPQHQRNTFKKGSQAVNTSQISYAYHPQIGYPNPTSYAPVITYPPPTPSLTPHPTAYSSFGAMNHPAYFPQTVPNSPAILPAHQTTPQHTQAQSEPPKTHITSTCSTVEIDKNDTSSIQTLLLTAKCRIINPHAPENSILATVFFDSGSQKSFIHDKIKSFLNLQTVRSSPVLLNTFGSDIPQQLDTPTVPFNIATTNGSFIPVEAQTVHKMIQPIQSINLFKDDLQMILNAESLISEKTEADILIGNDYFWKFMLPESSKRLPSGFFLINSRVGPMITGQGKLDHQTPVSCYTVMTTLFNLLPHEDEKAHTDAELQALEDVETIGIKDDPYLEDDAEAEKFINENIEIDANGRYQVPWLWKNSNPNLSSNFAMAFSQLRTMLNRIRAQPNAIKLAEEYIKYFKELFDLDIIEVAPEDIQNDPTVFLPHHVVFKPGSETTKFRVVFNGSAKQKDGEALNENLYAGPIKIPDLGGILLRFREKTFVVISDLEKAFLQVGLKPSDRNTTCFLWLKDPYGPITKENLLILRFTRVAFGIICSAYLLAAVIIFHLEKYGTPLSFEILRSIYIDNVQFSADTIEEAIDKFHESITLFQTAKMNLRDHGPHKVLGIPWDTVTDCLIMKSLKFPENIDVWTKRKVLKIIAQAFDPLGFLSPVHLQGKIFFQSLWKKSYSWDQQLNDEDTLIWKNLLNQTCGASISIPRYLLKNIGNPDDIIYELHVFVDASKFGYACACYLKTVSNGVSTINLIFAKTRLTPSKGLSIPKLELLALFIGVKAAKFIIYEMTYKFSKVYFWSDSYCVIYWISSRKEQKRFIENRLKFIRSFSDGIFRYVPTKLNPADHATRGIPASDIEDFKIWWHGPEFLHDEQLWPATPEIKEPPKEIIEDIPTVIVESTIIDDQHSIDDFIGIPKFHSLDSLLMTTFFVLRFLFCCKSTMLFQLPFLNDFSSTLNFAGKNYHVTFMLLIKISQCNHPPSKNEIATTRMYYDKYGILRCRPRVRLYGKADTRNHAIFLPRKAHLTQLIIAHFHKLLCHSGAAQTLANVRKQYWIPKARTIVRTQINNCYQCRRMNSKPYALPSMADLPDQRLKPTKPFQFIGLDMIGPLIIKTHERIKVWICIFTCLTTRAVHLEYVTNLSAPTFIQCLVRCFSRRGLPEQIISDNATQFVLAAKAFTSAYPAEKVTWKFNVPLAPWQGGIFERLVAIVKNAFRRSIGRKCLGIEEFRTFLCQVENTLNCRPITAVNSDLDSHYALRPVDFLIPEFSDPSLSIDDDINDPEYLPPDISSKDKLIKHWAKTLQHLHSLWDFWMTDYLTLLRERLQHDHKKPKSQHDKIPTIGEIVIVQDENLPKTLWQLAKIIKLHTSPDGKIRSATVLYQTGNELKRPINLLYPLEITDSYDPISTNSAELPKTTEVAPIMIENIPQRKKTQPKFKFGFKSTHFALMIFACLLALTHASPHDHKCSNDVNLQRIDVQDCATQAMAVMKQPNDQLCWKLITCTNGVHEPLGLHCQQNCTCPTWAEDCSFYSGQLTSQSTIQNEIVANSLKAEKPHVCAFTPNPACLDQPHIGRFPKITLYDNTSHLVNELHLYRKQIITDEFTCIGNGNTIGSPRYCELYPCEDVGTRFCYFKQAEAVFLVTDNGDVLIKAWGTATLTYYKHKIDPNENPNCSNCTMTCSDTGINLKLVPNIGNLRICYGAICHHKMHPDVDEAIILPTEVLLTTHKITAVIWSNGFVIQKLVKTCPPKEICNLIQCYFCWEIIGNPQCMPTEAIIVTAVLIYFIIMMLYTIYKIIKRSAKLLKHLTQLIILLLLLFKRVGTFIKSMLSKCIKFCIKPLQNHQRQKDPVLPTLQIPESPKPQRHNPFLYIPRSAKETSLSIGIVICLISTSLSCSDFVSISAVQESCIIESSGLSCSFNQQTLLSLSPHGQSTCLLLKNNRDENIGMVTLNIAKLAAYCKPATQYFSRAYIIKTKSSKRCRGAGSCHDSNCEETDLQTKIEELNGEANDSPGYTYCAASCGCITCSCFFCSPGCLFWRTYAIPKSDTIYEIFSCSSWEQKLKLDMTIEIGNTTDQHSFTLIPGQTSSWNHFKLSLISTTLPTIPHLNTKFITDYHRIAVSEVSAPGQQIPGTVGDFQCRTFEDAKKFKCIYPPNACRCQTLETKANCVCSSDQLQKLFNNGDQLLPLDISGITFEGWEKTVRAMYSAPSAIQLQIQINDLKIISLISNSKCTVTFNQLVGCYNCKVGAEVQTTCKSDFGSPLAYISCAGSISAIQCNPNGRTETLKFQFQESNIDLTCKIKCPSIETEAKLKGTLAFIGHDVHSSYQLIASEELHAASSLDFNFLLSWFSLQHHWLIFIIVLFLIFIFVLIIIKNLPILQAFNILSSAAKKEL